MSQWSHLYNDRRWRRIREAQLNRKPLCEECERRGQIEIATVCDHVEPHKGNLVKFWAGPFQSLCKYHHSVKTVMEDGGLNTGASTHPEWLPMPACRVVLVTGAPGSGKTTYCKQQRKGGDVVIDLDECVRDVCGIHGHEADKQFLKPALRLRNKLIAGLAAKGSGTAYLIVGAPSALEVQWWVDKLGAEHKRIETPKDVCLSRVSQARRQAVMKWFNDHEANTWTKPTRSVAIGVDGWPIPQGSSVPRETHLT